MVIEIPSELNKLISSGEYFVLAIDGRCGAGKTTLAKEIAQNYGAYVVHLDDFFLPKGREKIGHGNLEKERLKQEVLLPLSKREEVRYRIFSCSQQCYTEWVTIPAGVSVVVEGSYALLNEFRFAYTHSVFLTLSKEEQEKRIRCRNGDDKWGLFCSRWIPDEESYIEEEHPDLFCDFLYNI